MLHLFDLFAGREPARARMARWRLAPLVMAGALAAVLLAGCGDPVAAASVNGRSISIAAYQRFLSIFEISAAQQGQSFSAQTPADRGNLSQLQQGALDFLINAQLIHQQVQSRHIAIDAKVVQAIVKQLAGNVAGVATSGPTTADYKTLVKAADAASKQNFAKVDIAALMAGQPSLADAFVLFGYDEVEQSQLRAHVQVPQAHLRVIEVASMATATRLRDQVVKDHADFGQLAKQNSLDSVTAPSGGELGVAHVGQLGQIDPAFDTAVFGPSADYKAKTSYAIIPYQGKVILCEITQRTTVALSSLSDQQTQTNVFNAWLAVVVRASASIQQYVAVDPTPTTPPAVTG